MRKILMIFLAFVFADMTRVISGKGDEKYAWDEGVMLPAGAQKPGLVEPPDKAKTVLVAPETDLSYSIFEGKVAFDHKACLEKCAAGHVYYPGENCQVTCKIRIDRCMLRWCYGEYKPSYTLHQCFWWKQCYKKLCVAQAEQYQLGPKDCNNIPERLTDGGGSGGQKLVKAPDGSTYIYGSIYDGHPAFNYKDCLQKCEQHTGEVKEECILLCYMKVDDCMLKWCYGRYKSWYGMEQCDWWHQCYDKLCVASPVQYEEVPNCRKLNEKKEPVEDVLTEPINGPDGSLMFRFKMF